VGAARAGARRPARAVVLRQVIRAAAGALVAFVAFAASAAEPAVAFVADLKGSATIEGDGSLAFLAELPAGTRLLLGTGATVSITYAASGTEFALSGPGEFTIAAGEVRADRGATPSKRAVLTLSDPTVVSRAAHGNTATASLRMRGLQPSPPPEAGPVAPDALARARAAPVRTVADRVRQALRLEEIGARREAHEAWARVLADRPDLAASLAQHR